MWHGPTEAFCDRGTGEGNPPLSLPAGSPRLPGPESDGPRYVTQQDAEKFRKLLLAPMASWLESGRFVMRVMARPKFEWRYGEEWHTATKRTLIAMN